MSDLLVVFKIWADLDLEDRAENLILSKAIVVLMAKKEEASIILPLRKKGSSCSDLDL